jgi:hypothetical protein
MAKITTPTAFAGIRMVCIFGSPTNGSAIAAIRKITTSTTPTPGREFQVLAHGVSHESGGQPADWPPEGLQPVSEQHPTMVRQGTP